ncbi:MAG: aryl-alcohol dehydrogenase-like predicted oxidoreductase [Arenicella sp.]|jgi:aryl-alcohol dehydrogenase-like predicted oxidoreductase
MKKIFLGNSELEVSQLCLGTMYFGSKVDERTSFKILDAYLDHGGNFIDTANNYAWWIALGNESENLIGKWIAQRNNREDFILATKIGSKPVNLPSQEYQREGLRKDTIIKAVEDALKRLNTDSVDLCYIHADLEEYPIEERLEALEILQTQGKIRNKGCSNITSKRVELSEKVNAEKEYSNFKAVQQKYSYLLPNEVENAGTLKILNQDLLETSKTLNLSILTYSVLLSGAYSRSWEEMSADYISEENKKKFRLMEDGAIALGCSNSQWVLRWVMNQSDRIIPLIAASSLDQLKENIGALAIE